MKIEVSAPGKTILHGEHAVVYGKAAVAVSVSLKTNVTLVPHEREVMLNLKNLSLVKEWDLSVINQDIFSETDGDVTAVNEGIIKKITDAFNLNSPNCLPESHKSAVIAFLYLWIYISKKYSDVSLQPCHVEVSSQLSIGSGMGSSASYSVCLSTAMLIFCGKINPPLLPEDKELINKWAFQAEGIFHGKPSGIDNSICTYGGALLFEKGIITDLLPNLPNIKMLLVNTRITRNTKILVAHVRKKQELFPSVIDSVMNAIDAVSKESWKFLKSFHSSLHQHCNLKTLEDLIDMNHHLLNALDVSHPKLDKIHDVSRRYSLSSKLTGAGGGGCAVILLPCAEGKLDDSVGALKRELQLCDFDVQNIVLGCPGVQAELLES